MLPAQVRKVDPQKVITFAVPGATAAYSLDAFTAEAAADHGLVSVTGNHPGTTYVVAVAPSGAQTFEVLVTTPPPHYPPGFVMPVNAESLAESGYFEGRYYSMPAQMQNQFDFLKIHGDDRTHVHVVETTLLGPLEPGQPRMALSSATYQIVTPRRDITLFDKYLDESQLTINGSIVRGFHMEQDNWFVHAGYTSVATFEGLFLPTQAELVAGGGYRYPLTASSSLTGSLYQVQIPASDLLGRSGSIGDLRYRYAPRENFWFTADLGISRGIGGSGWLHYKTGRDTILALVRYMPAPFASLGANNLRGLHSDLSWTRHVTRKLESTVVFYNNNIVLPNLKETTISATASLRYQLTPHWSVTGGTLASSFQSQLPPSPALRSFTLPAGLTFESLHFGATGQYQFAVTPGRESGSQQSRVSIRSGGGRFTFTGYAERDTDAPTLSFILGQVPGLEQLLDQQGLRATTIQQVDQLLSSNSFLIAAGYIKGATINLVPVRTQLGGTADWTSRGTRRKQLSYSFLLNENQTLQGSAQEVIHTLSYSQSITHSEDVSLACSIQAVTNPGSSRQHTPICFIAWRHQFNHVPYFVIPERRGTIKGNVFQDDQSKGTFEPGMRPMPEVEIALDDRRRMLTHADGSYRFSNVPHGQHRIVAMYHSAEPFFFTTESELEAEENATVNFGIGHSLSGLAGQVLNDAGQGIAGVTVQIRSKGSAWSAVTDADGGFFVTSLAAGEYVVQVDEDSLPVGYSAEALGEHQLVTVGASSPGNAAFTARAIRSVSGRVLRYDSTAGRYAPVIQATVILQEPALTATTDLTGRYLFRDLTAGAYTLAVQNQVQASVRTVRLGAQPVDLKDVDIQLGSPAPPDVKALPVFPPTLPAVLPAVLPALPAARPVKPQNLAAKTLDSASGAVQHNARGRQLTQAHRYPEAIAELTEALRLAPDFALALNARGFARFMRHDWTGARADLDQAIRLNPSYRNAYKIRAALKGTLGDAAGAAADLQKSQQLAQ